MSAETGERKPVSKVEPMSARERARRMLAFYRRIRELAGKTDIHSHTERVRLEWELDELRNEQR